MEDRGRVIRIIYRQAVMVTLSMMMAVFIYGVIGFYAVQTGHPPTAMIGGSAYRLCQVGAFVAAILAFIGARFLTEQILNRQGAVVPARRQPKQLYVATIIRCAAGEFPVILGLILLFLSRDIYGFIPFALFGLAALFLSFPDKRRWSEWLGSDL
jgi:hypothetical protein